MSLSRVLSFSSGKGGVGKTTLVGNIGYALSSLGNKVLLVDGDWTLGKLSILLGARPKKNIRHVIAGDVTLNDAICEVSPGLSLLHSPSGSTGFEELSESERHQLFFELDALNSAYDYVLIDHSSGIHWGVLPFAAAAHRQFVVTTSEPTSLTDAYAIMKVLSNRFKLREFDLVVNQVQGAQALEVIQRFIGVTETHLNVKVRPSAFLSWDPKVNESISRQKLFLKTYPDNALAKEMFAIADRISSEIWDTPNSKPGLQFFYRGPMDEGRHASKG